MTTVNGDHTMDSHRQKVLYENILFLRYECGVSEPLTAKRLGISVANLRQILRRYGHSG